MKNTFLKNLALGTIILCSPVITMAWGTNGHRISGQIAEDHLSPKALAAVRAILGNESVAMASNWADFIKSDPTYSYLYNWHFVDFERPMSYPEMTEFLEHDNNVDAYTKLKFLIAELKKKETSKENKLLYLHMLIHITEDVHQPMHTAHASDKGGNDFKVNWFNKPTNLHSIWDSELVNFQELSYSEYAKAINHATPAQIKDWQSAPLNKWIFESSQLAEQIYTEIKPGDTLNYKYNFTHLDILNQQLLKGGIRLAGVLNEIFS
ncbi:S1/P1 nuclease [Mucilaginibacter sp.]|uniref:S1/P1 nuclease n=1 Tax=Mucilaginibacter sp. TaxID=1882438 RepID=UPI00262A1824|nr:S1/P1 nuclease [Mucilaginibacter sp.]MDB4925463.1 Nuclease [Mucilaginibacter sp.]